MNEKNLIPITKRSKEDARKIRSKGEKAMWEKTRAAKNFRESITLLLSAQLPKDSPYYKEVTALFEKLGISSTPCVRDLVDLGVLKKAANGDVQAAARAEHHKVAEELAELRAKAQKADAKDQTRTINGLVDRIEQLVHRQSDLRKALEEATQCFCHECYKASGDWCGFDDDESNGIRACPKIREWKSLARGER